MPYILFIGIPFNAFQCCFRFDLLVSVWHRTHRTSHIMQHVSRTDTSTPALSNIQHKHRARSNRWGRAAMVPEVLWIILLPLACLAWVSLSCEWSQAGRWRTWQDKFGKGRCTTEMFGKLWTQDQNQLRPHLPLLGWCWPSGGPFIEQHICRDKKDSIGRKPHQLSLSIAFKHFFLLQGASRQHHF